MILHLVSDEKVIRRTIQMFDEYDHGNNIFICFTNANEYRYLREEDNVIKWDCKIIDEIDFSKIDTVIIHYLNIYKIRFIYKHQLQEKIIVWIVWGSDLYNFLYKRGRYSLYSEDNSYPKLGLNYKTNVIYNRLKDINDKFALLTSKCATKVYSFYQDYYRNHFYINYLNYIQGTERTLRLIENGHKLRHLKGYLDFCYYPIEETLGNLSGKWCSGNNIMVGNSAQATNNHEYILKFLKTIDTSKYTITVPLSYGGDTEYINIINRKYSSLPNSRVLLEFMPLEDYNQLLLSSSVCIYGHFRGEAWGNILISLYLGAKVYLHLNSPIFQKCKRLGFKTFVLETISESFEEELTLEEKQNNRKIALANYSKHKCAENIKWLSNLRKD